jgi:hypothetical protein
MHAVTISIKAYDIATEERGWAPDRVERWWVGPSPSSCSPDHDREGCRATRQTSGDNDPVSDLPRSAVVRAARLASLPVGIAGRAAWGLGKRVGGKPAEIVAAELQARTAEQLFSVLGQLKGGAMKFGQALSIFESAFPEEMAAPYRAMLTKLQDSAPHCRRTPSTGCSPSSSDRGGGAASSSSTTSRSRRRRSARSTAASGGTVAPWP